MTTGFERTQARTRVFRFAATQLVEVMRNDCIRVMETDLVSLKSISMRTDDPFPVGHLLCLRIGVPEANPIDAIGAVQSIHLSDGDELGSMVVNITGMLPETKARWNQFIGSLQHDTVAQEFTPDAQPAVAPTNQWMSDDTATRLRALDAERPRLEVAPRDLGRLLKLVTQELPRQWAKVNTTDEIDVGTELDVTIRHPETNTRICMPGRVQRVSFDYEEHTGTAIVAFPKLSEKGADKLRKFAMTGRLAA